MIESTFQLASGFGPARERSLWRAGVTRWRDLPPSPPSSPSLPPSLRSQSRSRAAPRDPHARLRPAIADATAALADGDADRLAVLLPAAEHWRLFSAFGDGAAYLDIETGDDVVGYAGISAIGILDRHGPSLMLAERDLDRFVERARDWSMLVTFNGLSFDVPILRRAFPEWQPPRCHVDLRHLLARLGHGGGLKAIERRLSQLGLARPDHLARLDGWDACGLYRRGRDGDRAALRCFAEYNLYDVINLGPLMAWAYNGMVAAETADAPALRAAAQEVAVPGRGDVLYDVSKILLAL